MTSLRLTNYFENAQTVNGTGLSILTPLPADYVHIALSSLETRKSRSFWIDREEHAKALTLLAATQGGILMDATDRIVNEIRALRDGAETIAEERDPLVDPYSLTSNSLSSLNSRIFDVEKALYETLDPVNDRLVEIRDLLAQQTGGDPEEILNRLDTVILLLGAL